MRHADKWTAAVVLSNLHEIVSVFSAPSSNYSLDKRAYRDRMRRILNLGAYAFGSFLPRGARFALHLHPEIRKCKRAPKCTGENALCFFTEHSGILPPTAAVRFLRDCGFSPDDTGRIARDNLTKIQAGIIVARVCYMSWKTIPATIPTDVCCGCSPRRRASSERRRLLLLGWDPTMRHLVPFFPVNRTHLQMSASQQAAARVRHPMPAQQHSVPVLQRVPPEVGKAVAADTVQGPPSKKKAASKVSPKNVADSRTSKAESSGKSTHTYDATDVAKVVKVAQNSIEGGEAKDARNGASKPSNHGDENVAARLEATKQAGNVTAQAQAPRLPESARRRQADAGGTPSMEGLRAVAQTPVISYVVVDAAKMEHVIASGVDVIARAGTPNRCIVCSVSYMCIEVDNADEMLEIHLDQVVNPRHAATRLRIGMMNAHDVFAAAV